ncbi:putative late blight resistance protein homolog R1B-16 [Coffea arabica]|uniref:Late blight resistance protein homolog R1B-16 n=1 Tax=Coffea arabica TaxID=13443 RepID=A0A6P6VB48_COFAR|nr:putative late blight resistance protein homolog R1B-16 [Coffea arabica]
MANLAAPKFSLNVGGASSSEANSENFEALTARNYEAAGEVMNPIDYVELFEDEAKQITEELTNGLTQLSMLSIVGMPGIGKTTLANSIYQSPLVPLHFHVHARCCVTQLYQKRRLLLEILQQVNARTEPRHGLTDDELAEELYRSLKGKKYVIFFDDLWDTRLWNDMSTSFPDDNMGSRIMFTSRFHNIVSQIERKSITYPLNPLSEVTSWKLLEVKLFQKECCPQELLGVGMQMAINCKGLPLAVDLVVCLLRNKERRQDCWEQIANSLNTHLLADQQGRCWGILELSYNHLPNHLKPCFLYFRAFSEDEEVPVSELMWLWIAEGFVQPQNDEKGSLEDVAKKYLSDLIARSLIMKTKRGSLGGVKASRIHDLLRDFVLAKAKEECFMEEINGYEHLISPSCVHTMSKPYRLFVHSRWMDGAAITKPSAVRVRSLVVSRFAASCLKSNSFALQNFKLLRVLQLSDIKTDCWTSIFCLFHLRFLSLETYSYMIPPEISNLQSLETFLLRLKRYGEIELPETIWDLVKLRHFKIWGSSTLPKYNLEKFFKFDNLQTLATPAFCCGEDTEKILRGLPSLRKLSCILLDSWDNSLKCNRFPNLDFLTRLESLKLEYSGEVQQRCEFNFPSNLKKLTLSRFFLPWSEISTIGRLPNLEVLKLLCGAFEGKLWDMTEGEFLELKFLMLQNLNIAQWNASEGDHLPCLETLVLANCNQLEEIPSCLGDVLTLEKIELQHCRRSVEISARTIKEKQEEMGNEQFVITLK